MSAAETVAILGASPDPERYAFKAQRLLKENGHRVIPVSAKESAIDGDATVAELGAIAGKVDTLTVYVRPAISSQYRAEIEALKPRRVIFNPGTENPELADQFVPVATLHRPQLFVSFSRHHPQAELLLNRFDSGMRTLHRDGLYQQITERWQTQDATP